jgi:HTH-type transcriptional regulator/antitoxin HigA
MVTELFEHRPDYAVPPGETLRDTLEAKDMSQAELARRTGLSTKHVNQVIQGVVALTPEMALALEHVLGVPARMWNALEANYRQRELRLRQEDLSQADRDWLVSLPLKALIDRDAIPRLESDGQRFEAVLGFFGVASRAAWESVWRAPDVAFRRSKVFAQNPGSTASWLRLGEIKATEIETEPFDRVAFRTALDDSRRLLLKHPKHSFPQIRELCRLAGVALVVIPEIAGSRASGAARWLSPTKALVQLSLRYSWEDSFWFSFLHEAGHLLLHGKREAFVDDLGEQDDQEVAADAFAATLLIPARYDSELMRITTLSQVQGFARKIDLPPGIVVGRLQREKRLGRDVGNGFRHQLRLAADGSLERV